MDPRFFFSWAIASARISRNKRHALKMVLVKMARTCYKWFNQLLKIQLFVWYSRFLLWRTSKRVVLIYKIVQEPDAIWSVVYTKLYKLNISNYNLSPFIHGVPFLNVPIHIIRTISYNHKCIKYISLQIK